jgi:hypothetical protein
MKRNEITVGAELYYDRSTNWETTGYYASKAVVVDTERYKINRARWGLRSETAEERETAKREQERDLWNRAGVACESADTLGITAAPRCALGSDTRIEVSVDDFERLLDMANAHISERE